jgi:hypothetical protein
MAENAIVIIINPSFLPVLLRIREGIAHHSEAAGRREGVFIGFDRKDSFGRKRHLILIGKNMGLVFHMRSRKHEIYISACSDQGDH